MASNVVSIAFIHIALSAANPAEEDVKVHTGLGSAYPDTSPWSDYIGAGGLLSLGSARESAETSANEYELGLVMPTDLEPAQEVMALFNEVRDRDLQATPVCVHAVDIAPAQQSAPPEPSLLLVGRINQIEMAPGGIRCTIYTPAALLGGVVGATTKLNDLEHRRYIDSSDNALRFIAEVGYEVYFP